MLLNLNNEGEQSQIQTRTVLKEKADSGITMWLALDGLKLHQKKHIWNLGAPWLLAAISYNLFQLQPTMITTRRMWDYP